MTETDNSGNNYYYLKVKDYQMSSSYTDIKIPDEVMELVEEQYNAYSRLFLQPIKDNYKQTEKNRLIKKGMEILRDLILKHKKQVDAKFKESELVDVE